MKKIKGSRYYFYVLSIIILTIFLRFFMLTNHSLWYDEGASLDFSNASTLQESISIVRGIPNSGAYQPLYFIILFLWRQAFSDTEFALRSLSALLGVGSVIVIFFTTLRIYGKNHALWSSLILAFSSFCVYYSQEVRPYALLIFLASLQLYFFSKVLDKGESHESVSKLLFSIFTALGLFGNITMILFTGALCLSHIVIYRNPRRWLQWWVPAGFFCLPAILYYLTGSNATDPESISVSRFGFPIVQNAVFVLYGILVGTTYGPPQEQLRGEDKIQVVFNYWPHLLILLIVATVIFLALAITLLKHRNGSRSQKADYLFASLFVTSYFFNLLFAIVTKINWVPRHSFALWLPLAILIPSAFSQISKRSSKLNKLSRYALIAVTFLMILNIYSLFNYYFNKDYWRDDYRSAAQYLIKNRDSSAQSILLWGTPRLLKYYGDTLTLQGWNLGVKLRKGNFERNWAEQVESFTNNADTVFIVVNREHYFPKGSVERGMSNLYTLHSKVHFPYFNIYRFTRNKEAEMLN